MVPPPSVPPDFAIDDEDEEEPWPEYTQGPQTPASAGPIPAPIAGPPQPEPVHSWETVPLGQNSKVAEVARFSRSSTRPRWLIPAIAGGSVGAAAILGLGVYLAFFRGSGGVDPVESGEVNLAEQARPAEESAPKAPEEVAAPAVPKNRAKPATKATKASVALEPVNTDTEPLMSTAEIVAKYEPSVALINGKKGFGTGFVVKAGIVATNAHVIVGEGIQEIEVRFPSAEDGKQGPYPAKLLYQDKARDLALLGVGTELPAVALAKTYQFRKGEDVTVIGNPGVGGQMVLENAVSKGVVSSLTKINDQPFLQLGISINPGNSGGPVFDTKGRVIGVVTLKSARQEGLAFAIPADDLISALDTVETMASSEPAESPAADSGEPLNAPR